VDPRWWQIYPKRDHSRNRNTISRAGVTLVDDSGSTQSIQAEHYPTEIRYNQRLGEVGYSSVPLPGASAVALHQGGDRGMNTVIGIEDIRYRPVGMNGGETQLYLIDGAKKDGTGGTLRTIIQGLLGWAVSVFGATINIGTQQDTVTLNINGKTVNINGGSGDVVVNHVSLVHHVHGNVQGGTGTSGPPVQSS
jgi:phage baseplate assembly protein V